MLSCIYNDKKINVLDFSKEALREFAKNDELTCEVCGGELEYCHGLIKTPYFRHKLKECENKYSEAETEEHMFGKLNLYNWLKEQHGVYNVELEGYIKETKQRPDIMFEYKGKIHVLEYQCSPIATEYHERHELYNSIGITDIWICGTLKYFEKYNEGKRDKRLNELESITKKYYDPFNDFIFFVDKNINEKAFKRTDIIKDDFSNYDSSMTNLYYVKAIGVTYKLKNRRKGKRYIQYSEYKQNNSLAYCKRLGDVIIN